jgi:hypothetical protein
MDRKTQTFLIEREVLETLLCQLIIAKFNRMPGLASAARRAFRACQQGDIRELDGDARDVLDEALDGAFVSRISDDLPEDIRVLDYTDADLSEAAE